MESSPHPRSIGIRRTPAIQHPHMSQPVDTQSGPSQRSVNPHAAKSDPTELRAGNKQGDTALESTPAPTGSMKVSTGLMCKLSHITKMAPADLRSIARDMRRLAAEMESGPVDPKAIEKRLEGYEAGLKKAASLLDEGRDELGWGREGRRSREEEVGKKRSSGDEEVREGRRSG